MQDLVVDLNNGEGLIFCDNSWGKTCKGSSSCLSKGKLWVLYMTGKVLLQVTFKKKWKLFVCIEKAWTFLLLNPGSASWGACHSGTKWEVTWLSASFFCSNLINPKRGKISHNIWLVVRVGYSRHQHTVVYRILCYTAQVSYHTCFVSFCTVCNILPLLQYSSL